MTLEAPVHDQDPTPPASGGPAGRIEVVGGGTPSAAELAAVVVALTPAGGDAPAPEPTPAWARAALLEGAGSRRPTRPSDLGASAVLG